MRLGVDRMPIVSVAQLIRNDEVPELLPVCWVESRSNNVYEMIQARYIGEDSLSISIRPLFLFLLGSEAFLERHTFIEVIGDHESSIAIAITRTGREV